MDGKRLPGTNSRQSRADMKLLTVLTVGLVITLIDNDEETIAAWPPTLTAADRPFALLHRLTVGCAAQQTRMS